MKTSSYLVLGLCLLFLLSGCRSTGNNGNNTSVGSTDIEVSVTAKSDSSTSEISSSSSSEVQEIQGTSQADTTTRKNNPQLSDAQKAQINQAFFDWAGQRAAIGNMAVSEWFFDHGAAGHGDWYANTPDGQVQVQNNNMPGKSAFSIHAIGGCVFYTAKDGGVGKQELFADSFASNYSVKMDFSKPVSKYLLGDNGRVYELKSGNGVALSTNTGFGEYADDGSQGEYTPSQAFQISEDTAAHEKLQELIQSY